MSSELVVEGEDSAPMSEVCSRSQMDAIEELQEEEEQDWFVVRQRKMKASSMWIAAQRKAAEGDGARDLRGPVEALIGTEFNPWSEWPGPLHVDVHTMKTHSVKKAMHFKVFVHRRKSPCLPTFPSRLHHIVLHHCVSWCVCVCETTLHVFTGNEGEYPPIMFPLYQWEWNVCLGVGVARMRSSWFYVVFFFFFNH